MVINFRMYWYSIIVPKELNLKPEQFVVKTMNRILLDLMRICQENIPNSYNRQPPEQKQVDFQE